MASLVYAVWSITNVASVHCAARPEISPCTCEPTYAHNYVELLCEKVDSFHTIVSALSNKFEPYVNVSLKITHSSLEDLEMLSFMDMKMNLIKLRMQWNELKSVPELPFRGLSNVEYLGIGDNELEEVPKHMLNHMPVVKTLDIGRCRIRSVLQDDFKGVQMLTNLFMPSNNITRLDRNTFPPNLVTLHLGRNQIENLNGTLRHLNKLESLFINMNRIKSLDDELPESNRLKLIIAQNNRIERLPESMRNLHKLETLYIQQNRIQSLDLVLKNAYNLNELYASNNRIELLANDEFQYATQLEELYMCSNQIKSLNGSLLPLKKLYKANFSFNAIEEFSMDEIRGLLALKQLDLSNNRIRKLSGSQGNNIDKSSYLLDLYLDYNELTTLDGALMGLNSLRILRLTHNKLERILPEDFIGLEKLEILELSHNRLVTLREMQTTVLPSLKILKVDFNNLTILDKDFHGLPVLCQANLTHNQIISISRELVAKTSCVNHNVPGRLELYLEDNPFSCNMLLDEYCPLMKNTEKQLRLRTKCFEAYEEVCQSRQYILMLPSVNLSQQQVIPVIVPSTELLKKADNLLPPLFAPLAGGAANIKPLIITPAIKIVEAPVISIPLTTTSTTTTTTTTTTPAPTTTTTSTIATTTADTTNYPLNAAMPRSTQVEQMNETNDNETQNPTIELTNHRDKPSLTGNDQLTTTATTQMPTLNLTSSVDEVAAELPHDSVVTQNPAILVVNIDNAAVSDVLHSNPVAESKYSTVEYIPNLEKIGDPLEAESPQQPPPEVLIEEDSKSNAIHEEYHNNVMTDYGSAPQNLLQPDEPPENP
ncbi:leucine-rich repeats and immunoglobulin-like domains protein 1 [Musca vetustissima]|uniref:leucine-rich repeats and immunoglobulin-like domains protein 1 n=1 Tax=Musca vetustissima TaxID=27455 RepID=UPI002AB7E430|nr:leucine-rich repeats and immunoglobulin-like domains protein 1 [Musca vetustissima]